MILKLMIMSYIKLCVTFKIDYLQEMDIIMKVKARLERKINVTLPALLPNKIAQDSRGPATSSEKTGHEEQDSRTKRAIPLLAIAQGTAAIGGMLIKGINALVDIKRANSFNNAIKMLMPMLKLHTTDLSLLKTEHQ